MKPEEQRIAIAKFMGYPNPCMGVFNRCYAGELPHLEEVPDYLNDLNAMHDAEKVLREMQTITYVDRLGEIVSQGMGDGSYGEIYNILHATAAQRAEALLRTLNLWKE